MKIYITIFSLSAAASFLLGETPTINPDDHAEEEDRAFMELPGIGIPNEHNILKKTKIVILEKKDLFVMSPMEAGDKNGETEKITYGIVFLNKKKERGLPVDQAKKKMLFSLLDAKMKEEGITNWYIFQMRSTNEDLLGVYGVISK